MLSDYEQYNDYFCKGIRGIDHISAHEFDFFSELRWLSASDSHICRSCAWKKISESLDSIKAQRRARYAQENLEAIFDNSYPYINRDEHIFMLAEKAIKDGNLRYLEQIRNIAFTLKAFRSADILNATLMLDPDEIIPEEVAIISKDQRQLRTQLRSELLEGLAINVPINLPIDDYIDLIREVRPQINDLVQEEIASPPRRGAEHAITMIKKRVMEINRQIERLESSTRYAAVNALGTTIKDNPIMFGSILSAAALGLAGSLIGCSATLAGGYAARKVARWAKSYPTISSSESKRFGRFLRRDLQPGVDTLIAKYMGVERSAVRVLSIRKRLISRT
ncbi:hypothetical protein KKP04_12490 [Rhodomicrobium sp. Az07]|uniref:hypothetical protein n=1 Tax=Rhodomicrobium sp. Az07 TaxID=2839034 RepID=UPI001BE7DFCB|nr:hypothetical protein [Rhodomicrobium sp. Az07]MBT3071681.1 hypothetical protein [Rhodomicrobium sp. Az07]